MDEYVTVEAYDVMLGSSGYTTVGSDDPDKSSAATGTATASWNLSTGVTGQGWDLPYYDFMSGTVKTMNVQGATHEEVEAKIVPYLHNYGGSYINMIGCS